MQSRDARQSVGRVGRLVAIGLVLDAAPPTLLGPVHRVVGFAQEIVGLRFIAGDGHSDACADEQGLGVHLERLLEDRGDPCDRGMNLEVVAHVLDDHHELVPAEPCDRIGPAQAFDHALRDLAEEAVARVVAETVVDELEPVEVEEEHRYGGLVAA